MKKRIYDFSHPVTREEYIKIIDTASKYCNQFYFVVSNNIQLSKSANNAIDLLRPFISSIQKTKEWPGTVNYLDNYALLHTYYLNAESEKLLKNITNDLYSWTEPFLPEDLGFLRIDNSPWFVSITHEKDCYMELTEKEKAEINKIFPGLLINHINQEINVIARNNKILDIASDMLFTAFTDKSLKDYLEGNLLFCKAWYNEIINDIKQVVNYKNVLNIPSLAIFYEFENDLYKILENSNRWKFTRIYNDDIDSSHVREIIKQKKQLATDFKLFVDKNREISTTYFLEYFLELTNRYSEIHPILRYTNLDHWQNELFDILNIRNDIHYATCFASDNNVEINIKTIIKIKEIDETLQAHFKEHFVAFNQDIITKAEISPNSHWWWHLHELDKLSKKDLETI